MRCLLLVVFLLTFCGVPAQAGLVDNDNGTVTDTVTGLMWQKATAPGKYTWQQALAYAEGLDLAGHTDWRLPNINELLTIVDYSRYGPAVYPVFASDTVSLYYWSSTTYALGAGVAWFVSFQDGNPRPVLLNSVPLHVRAVRLGFTGSVNSLAVSIEPAEARAAGAQWRRVGTTDWHDHEVPESNVPAGSHTIEFKNISGWNAPANMSVTVTEGQTTTATGTYTVAEIQHTVTASAGEGGSIEPDQQQVADGETAIFTVTSDAGYSIDEVIGCGGNLVEDTYTTGAITGACTVTASFNLNQHTVTPSSGANGTITPSTAQTVNHGAFTTFTVTPNTGYIITVGGTCGGTLDGTTYTTKPITAPCTVQAQFVGDFDSGDGSAETPYQIGTASQLANIRHMSPGDHFVLSQDIDLNVAPSNEGAGWTPIGTAATPFTGTFNGNGHLITNLFIDRPDTDNVGLFGVIGEGGRVHDLGVSNVQVVGLGDVGALAGRNQGSIQRVHADGEVFGAEGGGAVGGLVGRNSGAISQSYAAVTVSSFAEAGGLVGVSAGGTITDCYATGFVGGVDGIGGQIGGADAGEVSRSYATGLVVLAESGQHQGGLIGKAENNPVITFSYWDTQTSLQTQSAGGQGLTTAQMRDSASFAGWEFGSNKTWNRADGVNSGYPYLTFSNLHDVDAQVSPENTATVAWTGAYPHGAQARLTMWVDDATGNRIKQWYTATQTGCPAVTGTCSITPSVNLAAGNARFWIHGWNQYGNGPWSDRMDFRVQ